MRFALLYVKKYLTNSTLYGIIYKAEVYILYVGMLKLLALGYAMSVKK